jgi:hypothetical protein
LIVLGFACSKDLGLYKNSYTGSYNGTKRDKSWIMYQNAKDTLYEYRFELIPKLNDSVIIKGPGIYQVFMPDSDGYYYDAGWPGNFIEIILRNDSCFYIRRNGGLGGYEECEIIGRKVN